MDDPKGKSVPELLAELEELGISRDEVMAHLDDTATQRQYPIEIPDDDALTVIASKLDKLQESVDSLAAQLDAKDSA